MSQSDPTDHALAAIASILDESDSRRQRAEPAIEEHPIAPEPITADGYSKIGPGPMEAIRFKWTVRHEGNGEYFVDETIGQNSRPVVSGPMTPDAAIAFVDAREMETRRRFEALREEMSGQRVVPADPSGNPGGER